MGDLNITRNMVANALNDTFSPKKVDKFEAVEIKENLTKNGGQVSEASKAFLADQVNAGRFDAGAAAVMEGLFSAPTQDFNEKVVQQADVALKSVHESLDFGFFGGVGYDNTVSGSENAADAAKMAETYLNKLKELSNDSSNLESIIDATLTGGQAIKDDEKRLNSYLKTLSKIKADHTNNDKDMKRLASDAIDNIHTAVQSNKGQVFSSGGVKLTGWDSTDKGIYNGAYRQLDKIRDNASNQFIRNQADNALKAAYDARGYSAKTNIIIKTLQNIAGGELKASPAPLNHGPIQVETTVNVETKIKQ